MFLLDDIDVRDELQSTRFDGDPVTVRLWQHGLDGDFGDEEATWPDGSGMARYGRVLLRWDDQGFVWSEYFPSAAAAADAFARAEEPEPSVV